MSYMFRQGPFFCQTVEEVAECDDGLLYLEALRLDGIRIPRLKAEVEAILKIKERDLIEAQVHPFDIEDSQHL